MTSFEYFTLVFREADTFLYALAGVTIFIIGLLLAMKATPFSYFYLIYFIPANVTGIFLLLFGYLDNSRWILIFGEVFMLIIFVSAHLHLLKRYIKLDTLIDVRFIWFPVVFLVFFKFLIFSGDKKAYLTALGTTPGFPVFVTMVDICSYILIFHYSRIRKVLPVFLLGLLAVIGGIGTGSNAGFIVTCTSYIAAYLTFHRSPATNTITLRRYIFRIFSRPSLLLFCISMIFGFFILSSQFVNSSFVIQRLLMGSDITFSLANTTVASEVVQSTDIWRDLVRPISLRMGDYYSSVGESIRQALHGGAGYGGVNFRIVPFTMLTYNYFALLVACLIFFLSITFFARLKVSLFSKHFLVIGLLLASFYFYQDYYKFLSTIVLLTLITMAESVRLLIIKRGKTI